MGEVSGTPHTLLVIRSHLNSFTKTERKVAQYVLENTEEIVYLSVTELAERVDVGETTVLRFCRKLKFKGFQDFKISLAKTAIHSSNHTHKEIQEDDEVGVLRDKVIQSHNRVIEDTRELLHPVKLEQAIDYLVHAEFIQFYGVGTSNLTAIQAAHLFTRIGKSSDAKQDTHFQAMTAALLTKKDVAVGISVSGDAKDTIDNLKIAKQAGARTICITSNARSPITKIADVDLIIAVKENPLHGSSITSKMAQLSAIDVLYTGVMLRTKETALKYRERTAKAVSEKLQ